MIDRRRKRRGGRCARRALLFITPPAACLLTVLLLSGGAPAAPGPIYVFPIPGSRVASPQTQISFRGTPVPLSAVTVTGSKSGAHSGQMLTHTDGKGSSFLPTQPFDAGETVTVTGPASIAGSRKGVFTFRIAEPAGWLGCQPAAPPPRVPNDVLHFRSRPDLVPANVEVRKSSPGTAPGDVFVGPAHGPVQAGPMIVGPRAGLIWFKPVPQGQWASDFRAQRYRGKPVLTWWQGCTAAGFTQRGRDLIYDSSYRQVASVQGANGVPPDLHEFNITPQGTALITSFYPVIWNATSVGGASDQDTIDSVVQEIDIRSCHVYSSCLVLYQWDSLDHVPLTDSVSLGPGGPRAPYDYFHINSVELDKDGQLVISARNTSAAYKISHKTGRIIWQLGGKRSSFQMGPGASFAFQHDVRVHAYGDQYITVFDDGANAPGHSQSRGLKLRLDLNRKTATMVFQYLHQPPLLSYVEGNAQQLPNLDMFVGWGSNPYFSEFDRTGTMLFDARFVSQEGTYRAYRFAWTGAPQDSPAIAASNSSNKTFVYASWNGATKVASWSVEGGSSPGSLHPLKVAAKGGFETTIEVSRQGYVAVQALDGSGRVLGTSRTVKT